MLSFEEKTCLKLWEIFLSQIFVAYIINHMMFPPLHYHRQTVVSMMSTKISITHVLQVVSLTSKDYEVAIHMKNENEKKKTFSNSILFTLAIFAWLGAY